MAEDQEYEIIKLTKGAIAIVDTDDFEQLSKYRWYYNSSGYACGGHTYMHRKIMKAGPGQVVDHVNGDKLDNRRGNLRIVNRSQNLMNSKAYGLTSPYKGVYFETYTNKWRSIIKVEGKRIHLGRFINEVDAAIAYDEAAKKYFGQYARLNFPLDKK